MMCSAYRLSVRLTRLHMTDVCVRACMHSCVGMSLFHGCAPQMEEQATTG
eukprot:m.116396 g.116396  ORF g.116396 m.116396 type:complete len:50 (+) comp10919_c0_seq2:46-195(+)